MKKKVIIIPLILLLAGGAGAGGWYYYNQNKSTDVADAVTVDKLSNVLGIPSLGGNLNRFAGVVEPQKTESIELANGLKVKKNYVTVGTEVNIGDKLFEYDTEDAQDQITQLEIDIENADISIESDQNQVKELEKYRDKAKEEDKLSITTQIMTTQNSIKRYEYEKKGKIAEMESLKKQIANAVVKSEFQGIVKTINSSQSGNDSSELYGGDDSNSNAYMTIMSTGEYRIKSMCNEQNMMQIHVGAPVLVYSRVDESLVWHGTINNIDKEHASSNNNSMWGSSDESMTSSSSYPFYIEMESSEGLMLGQHVYVEEDLGQNDLQGIWLEDYYFIPDEDGNPTNYIWAANDRKQLEKREVTLGKYDEELMSYEVVAGLSLEDYITFPDASYAEGMPVNYNDDIDWSQQMGTDWDDEEYIMGDDEFDEDMEELDFEDGEFEDFEEFDMEEIEFEDVDDEDMDFEDDDWDEEDDEIDWEDEDAADQSSAAGRTFKIGRRVVTGELD